MVMDFSTLPLRMCYAMMPWICEALVCACMHALLRRALRGR